MKKILAIMGVIATSNFLYAPIDRKSLLEIVYQHFDSTSILKKEALTGNKELQPLTDLLLLAICPPQSVTKAIKSLDDSHSSKLDFKETSAFFLEIENLLIEEKCYKAIKTQYEQRGYGSSTYYERVPYKFYYLYYQCHTILEDLKINVLQRADETALFFIGYKKMLENIKDVRSEFEKFKIASQKSTDDLVKK